MRVLNKYYINRSDLADFIEKNKITKEKNVLVQIFSGELNEEYLRNIIFELKEFIPNVKIIGATTDGEICNDEVSTNKTVLSFNIFKNTKIVTKYANGDNSQDTATKLFKGEKTDESLKLLITFINGLHINEEYIKTIENITPDLTVAGGLAGDNANFKQTFIFTEKGIYKNGAVGAFFYNRDLSVHSEYNFGWKKIGKKLKVTKAKENIVYTIDNIPAKDIYMKYLGDKLLEFPLIVTRNNTDVARAILETRDDGSLVFAGNIEEGSFVQFGYGNINEILNKNGEKFTNINNKPSEGYFIYSCMARRRLIGDRVKDEILPLASTASTCGFFTYGEFYHNATDKKNELLNETMTILSISEDKHAVKNINMMGKDEKNNIKKTTTIQALSNLIAITSKELQELNETLEDKINKKTKELEHQFYYNDSTNLRNHNALLRDLEETTFNSLIILDIDEFNYFNELYGVETGNEILRFLANHLNNTLNKEIYDIYHFHGDQFAIKVKVGTKNPLSIKLIIKDILKSIKEFEYCTIEQKETLKLDVTLGISNDKVHPIQKSLIALSDAKKSRRSYTVYSIEMDHSNISKDMLLWKKDLKNAISHDNIIPVFQPIVDRKQNTNKYEILMRLKKNVNGEEKLISPFFFLDIAKKIKLYPELSRIMMEKSFKVIAKRDEKFSFNLSFEDLTNKTTMNFLKNHIEKYHIGEKLILEIVESSDVGNYKVVKNFIKEFKSLGVQIAIDDFGSGFSNYMHIFEIEPDFLKIDGSLIKNIDKCKKSYEFVKSIVTLSKALNIKTVAEFIHSKEIFDICYNLGVDHFQGFYFSEPLEENKLETLKLECV